MNRQFQAIVVLDDGQAFSGISLYAGDIDGSMKSLVFGGFAGSPRNDLGEFARATAHFIPGTTVPNAAGLEI
ncbi:hypothetical protein E2562_002555 [Oryza meyeriana var. granulata]|uniref:Uncharacterized protein n=1 Tax=Oryza meyeriana var. granulata TaxID=110450 RepID=A0A6G1F2S4_9ORYZ|nr:hypothetical protein E2562_002555 [Oryza meyeriana var. granulata]